jgi:ubiquinone/menaquinone biosynthesis C-methylase UbiE
LEVVAPMSREISLPHPDHGVQPAPKWTPDTRFGAWFQRSAIWKQYVVEYALDEFVRMLGDRPRDFATILDAGCGAGQAFDGIARRFAPQRIVAIDIAPAMLPHAHENAARGGTAIEVQQGDLAEFTLPDASVDLVLCHQALHHVDDQPAVLRNFFRVLKPGGTLLLAESCRSFTRSWPVWLLFRHRADTQRTASAYLELLRAAGFAYQPRDVSNPDPFWSRPDFGIWERLGFAFAKRREPAELQVIARRP